MDTKFATKEDFNHLNAKVDRLDIKMDQVKSDLLFKMGAMMAGSTTITVALLSFIMNY